MPIKEALFLLKAWNKKWGSSGKFQNGMYLEGGRKH